MAADDATTTTTTTTTVYHEITISLSSPDIIRDVISLVRTIKPSWESESLNTTFFTDGISNKLIGCYHGDRMSAATGILVRINGLGTDKIIDRQNEINTFNILSASPCMNSAKLIAVFANGLCYEYLDGIPLDKDTVCDTHIAKLIAVQMAQMHFLVNSIPGPKLPSFEMAIAKLLTTIPKSFDDPSKQKLFETYPKISWLEGEINSLVSAIKKLNFPLVLSHNDLLVSNILFEEKTDKIKFIDFEYSGYNYNCYDIGNHFAEYAGITGVDYSRYPSKEYQVKWIRDYLEKIYSLQGKDPSSIPESEANTLYIGVNLSALAAHLYWALWSVYQASNSAIEFDFLSYGKKRIDEFMARKQESYALMQ